MGNQDIKIKRRIRRKRHIRKIITGTSERLRFTVNRSLKHIYAQIIDDEEMKTVVSASTVDKEIREQIKAGIPKIEQGKIVGAILAKRALEANVKKVAFDRNGYLYHGRVKALAEAVRAEGLEF